MVKKRKILRAYIRAWVNRYFKDVSSVSASALSQSAPGKKRTTPLMSSKSSYILKINSSPIANSLKEYFVEKILEQVQKNRVKSVLRKLQK
jgi:hypothetical protein